MSVLSETVFTNDSEILYIMEHIYTYILLYCDHGCNTFQYHGVMYIIVVHEHTLEHELHGVYS